MVFFFSTYCAFGITPSSFALHPPLPIRLGVFLSPRVSQRLKQLLTVRETPNGRMATSARLSAEGPDRSFKGQPTSSGAPHGGPNASSAPVAARHPTDRLYSGNAAHGATRALGASSPLPDVTDMRTILAAVDLARLSPARPYASLFVRPRIPIRENYMHRLLVNVVWNARNYTSLVLVITMLCALVYPFFFLVVIPAALLQRDGVAPVSRVGFGIAQAVFVLLNAWSYGLWPGFGTSLLCAVVTTTHAVLTPYTDEAYAYFDSQMRTAGIVLPPPRTPVVTYVGNDDPAFPSPAAKGTAPSDPPSATANDSPSKLHARATVTSVTPTVGAAAIAMVMPTWLPLPEPLSDGAAAAPDSPSRPPFSRDMDSGSATTLMRRRPSFAVAPSADPLKAPGQSNRRSSAVVEFQDDGESNLASSKSSFDVAAAKRSQIGKLLGSRRS